MNFISTRGGEKVSGARAIVQGLSANGGLYVPESFPTVSKEELESMLEMSYPERATKILLKYLDEYKLTTVFICWSSSTDPHVPLRIWHSPFFPTF
jgi:threonine synthase